MERLIPISRKQHDSINTLKANEDQAVGVAKQAARDLSVYVQPFIDGLDEEIPPSTIKGARCSDGVYSLVIDVPEPPKVEEPVVQAS